MNTINDGLYYLVLGNPVSHGLISAASTVARSTIGIMSSQKNNTIVTKAASNTSQFVSQHCPLWQLVGRNMWLIRMAGVGGATAVVLGAYGSHRIYNEEKGQSKAIFDTANRFHFFHSLALLISPLCRQPVMTGSLLAFGTIMFSGPCYYRAFTGDNKFSKIAPFGGFCLIVAWLTMML